MRSYPSQAEELVFYMVFIYLFITAHLTLHANNSNVYINQYGTTEKIEGKMSAVDSTFIYG